ncbi:MAG TPA: gluconate 2-dehydrogenase subunit 3 family protein [Stellaceae bacterium]|nr:gluconate 2-dehydrogenase subunit 3 family protein [Stellaceae bacterium]
MTKHDEARRTFLKGAAASAGAVAGAAFLPEARAQGNPEQKMHGPIAHAEQGSISGGAGQHAFFNDNDAMTIAALTERIMPDAPGKPGARAAGVPNYIDLALAGAYKDQQDFYRRGLAQLDAHCHATYKRSFAALTAAQQDEVVAALATGKADGFAWPTAQAFFSTVRTHTMEGMFADPVYGGNRDFAGWQLAGFPGAQMQYTEADLKSSKAFTRLPITGLEAQAKSQRRI